MKKPINIGQALALGSFFSVVILLLSINLMKNTLRGRIYSTVPYEVKILKLTYKSVSRAENLKPFSSLTIALRYIDSLIFIPSETPRVEITGDKVLIDGLRIYRGNSNANLIIGSKFYYRVDLSEEDSLQSNGYSLYKGGLIMKIYYQELNNISINERVKTIVHKGVFKVDQLSIHASANTAQFNVEAKHLKLHLEKPTIYQTAKPLTNTRHQYADQKIQYVNRPLRVVGKADLVEIIHSAGSIVDLTQLHCRHVHADYARASYSILEVAPTQLFSYIIPPEDAKHHSQMICTSKARVTKARHIPGLTERFH